MNVCPNCSHNNRVGVLICDNCGASIFDDLFRHTKEVRAAAPESVRTASLETRCLVEGSSVVIRIADAPTPIRFVPEKPVVLGRVNNQNPRRPDIDLTVYRAFEKGVSCRHASIQQDENRLVIADLGSTNGTCVNGERLPPHEPCTLRDGDEVRLGNLFLKVYLAVPN
jgi:hypothetical protein